MSVFPSQIAELFTVCLLVCYCLGFFRSLLVVVVLSLQEYALLVLACIISTLIYLHNPSAISNLISFKFES